MRHAASDIADILSFPCMAGRGGTFPMTNQRYFYCPDGRACVAPKDGDCADHCLRPEIQAGDVDRQLGLYGKYRVERMHDAHGKHAKCDYFVLDLVHDKYATAALTAYASACESEYPLLAKDLRAKLA